MAIKWYDKLFERRKEENRNKKLDEHRRKADLEQIEKELEEAFTSTIISINKKKNAQNNH